MPTLNLGREPIAIITTLVLALGALNTQVSGLTPTAHNVISGILVVLGAVLARAAVTPTAAPKLLPIRYIQGELGHVENPAPLASPSVPIAGPTTPPTPPMPPQAG